VLIANWSTGLKDICSSCEKDIAVILWNYNPITENDVTNPE